MIRTLGLTDSPRLLVSVRNASEAESAIAGGVDVLDVKDPSRGPLGRADVDVLRNVASAAARLGLEYVTAALGELREWTDATLQAKRIGGLNLTTVKVGLAGERFQRDWERRFDQLAALAPDRTPLIAAAYADANRADSPTVAQVVAFACRRRLGLLLIDTFQKDGRGLLHWLDVARLKEIRKECFEHGVGLALAGSLTCRDVEALADVQPAVFAVRGAACVAGDRGGAVCADRVRALRGAARGASVARTKPPL